MITKNSIRVFAIFALACSLEAFAPALGSDFERSLDERLEKIQALELAPGMSVAVVRGGETLYLKGFGWAEIDSRRPVRPDTVYYIASSTKSFTGLAAALLEEKRALDLDAHITRYVPDIRLHPQISADEITLRDLLTHTHGIANRGPVVFRTAFSGQHTREKLMSLLRHHGPAPKGREFEYSNIGYNLASLIMDEALGKSWKDVLAEEIFRPLGMKSTTAYISKADKDSLAMPYSLAPKGFDDLRYTKGDENMHAAGGLVTTAEDLALWLKANIGHGKLEGEQLLPAAAFEQAHKPYAETGSQYLSISRESYGLGWHIGRFHEEVFLHHFGGFSGFHAHIGFMPEHGLGVAVLVNNAGTGGPVAEMAAGSAYDLLLGKPGSEEHFNQQLAEAKSRVAQFRERIAADRARRAQRDQNLPRPLTAYAGVYENPLMGRATFEVVDGELEFSMGRLWSEVEVYDSEKNALRIQPTGGGRVVFFEFEGDEATGFRFGDQFFEKAQP